MQMHSASETKAVFVGSQRPPPQSPSSFPCIGTLTFPTVMRLWITLSLLLPHTLSHSLPACLSLSLLPVSPSITHGTGQRMDIYSMRFNQKQMRIYSWVPRRRNNLLQWSGVRCTLGITMYPWVGLQIAPT